MLWRLVIKEFGPELKYIKVKNKAVADAFSSLKFTPNTIKLNIPECFRYGDEDLNP